MPVIDDRDIRKIVSPYINIVQIIQETTLLLAIILEKANKQRCIMKYNIVINGQNLIDYKSFILFFSKAARKQYFINTFMIFTEAIIAGFVVDMLLKSKIFTII